MLINPLNLSARFSIYYQLHDNLENKDYFIIKGEPEVILTILSEAKWGKPDFENFYATQIELRPKAVKWLVDVIEQKFWKSASLGGLPSGVYSYKETIDGEKIGVFREMNVGAKGRKGFRITNYDRHDRAHTTTHYQDFWLPDDILLERDMLMKIKEVVSCS
ncbi:hypothetical protein [Flocculibacter collagenilyticus]|uniref:hypothetical protein n=1 Tax=Flocculibacter collagenilyticus TaxID=2744479 RepID=UPI0018F6F452|nr:hypothetical protein [Flocculibacter collagenilyticus]